MLRVCGPVAGRERAEGATPEAAMQIEPMGEGSSSNLPGKIAQRPTGSERDDAVHVWIVAEQRRVSRLGDHGQPGVTVALPDRAEQGSGQEDVADRAEAHGQDIRRWRSVGHGGEATA